MAPRNDHYRPNRDPSEGDSNKVLNEKSAKGATSWMNPTQARFTGVPHADATQDLKQDALPPGSQYNYNTRDARKGRHAVIIDPTNYKDKKDAPSPSNSPKAVAQTIWRMCSSLPFTNLSWCTAIIFAIGSAVFIVSAFMSFLPLEFPTLKEGHPEVSKVYSGWFAFIGSGVFVLGSVFMILEAVNERRTAAFGYSIYQEFDDENPEAPAITKYVPTKAQEPHDDGGGVMQKAWIWLPTWKEFTEHYLHEIGFLACMIQAVSSIFFFWSNICAIPPIYDRIEYNTPLLAGVFWSPKLVGCTGFTLSGLLLARETQPAWFKPAFGTIGWWSGMFKVTGGVGFMLGAGFGYDRAKWAQYYSALSVLWGSFAFLTSSLLLWFESLQPYPVHVRRIDNLDQYDEEKRKGSKQEVKATNVGGLHSNDIERHDGLETASVRSGGSHSNVSFDLSRISGCDITDTIPLTRLEEDS